MKKPRFLNKIKPEYIFLAIILLFGLFLRIYALGNPPFWVDEAISANVAKSIITHGVPVLDSGFYYDSAYFLHYSMAFFMLFAQNEFFARFPGVIFGLLTILLAYKIGKEYSKTGGIISALFFSVFYLEVFFSRQARYYQLFQLAFFASLYFLYKSKEKPVYLIPALISFFLALNTHLEALVLAPFFIIHILYYSRKYWYSAILPAIPLIKKLIPASKLSAGKTESAINYASDYYHFAHNMRYLLILFIPGLIWAFIKKKRLTLLIILPSLLTLAGVFTLQTFALRYSYFFVFPLIIYSSLLISFLYERYGKIMLISVVLLLVFPSNLFFPGTYVNIIKPIDYNLNDYSAPATSYKLIPENIISELKSDTTLISYYSPDVEWYIRKPDYVLPFSMDGRGDDQISMNNSENQLIDRYSGAPILNLNQSNPNQMPNKPYHLIADDFSVSKLKPAQKDNLDLLVKGCDILYEERDVKIYECK